MSPDKVGDSNVSRSQSSSCRASGISIVISTTLSSRRKVKFCLTFTWPVTSRHFIIPIPCILSQEKVVSWRVETWREATSRVFGQHAQHTLRDTLDTQHRLKCGAHSLAANSSANVLLQTIRLLFWLVHHVKIIALLLSPKNYQRGSKWRLA